jgi:hypothetical protein
MLLPGLKLRWPRHIDQHAPDLSAPAQQRSKPALALGRFRGNARVFTPDGNRIIAVTCAELFKR